MKSLSTLPTQGSPSLQKARVFFPALSTLSLAKIEQTIEAVGFRSDFFLEALESSPEEAQNLLAISSVEALQEFLEHEKNAIFDLLRGHARSKAKAFSFNPDTTIEYFAHHKFGEYDLERTLGYILNSCECLYFLPQDIEELDSLMVELCESDKSDEEIGEIVMKWLEDTMEKYRTQPGPSAEEIAGKIDFEALRIGDRASLLEAVSHNSSLSELHLPHLKAFALFEESHLTLEVDWGGQVLLSVPQSQIKCSFKEMDQLLSGLNTILWPYNEGDGGGMSFQQFAHYHAGLWGGMGGGLADQMLWVHPRLEEHKDLIDAYIKGENPSIKDLELNIALRNQTKQIEGVVGKNL